MLTTSKPLGSRARTALAAGLALWVAGCTPPGPKALLDGERLLREGRTEDAIRRLRTAVEFLPSQPQAWNHLGLAYHAAKKPSDAVEAYQQALRLDRNLAAAYFNSGCLYLENGEPGLATDALWAFVGLQPRVIEGWVKLGQAQLRTRRWDQAERSFQEALRLSPGRVDALNGVGIAFHQRRKVQEAWSSFTNAVIRDPSFAPAWLNLGVIAHQSGAPGKAVQAYRQYAALRPTSAQQLGLEAVIRKLELPPPSPTIQLPPAAPAGSGETNPPPAAAAAPPAPDAKSSDAAARVSAATGTPGAARPPPVASAPDATIPAPSESPAAVAGTEKALVAATAAESTPSTNREAGSVAVPVPQESPSPASPAPVPLLASNAVAAASPTSPGAPSDAAGNAISAPAETPVASSSTESSAVASPAEATAPTSVPAAATTSTSEVDPQPGLVLPTPIRVVASLSKPGEDAAPDPASVVPLDRVRIDPPENLANEVRDETNGLGQANESAASGAVGGDGLPPLVRPVGTARGATGADRGDRRGFWSRANPVSWFGGDAKTNNPAADAERPAESASADEGSGTWRWANPMTWFRGGGEDRSDRKPEGTAAPAVAEPPPAPTGGAEGTRTQPTVVASAETAARPATPAVGSDAEASRVRRSRESAWTARPSDTPPPRRDAGPGEWRRYTYLNPAKPETGDRAAAKNVLAQAMQEHRRDRTDVAVRLYEEALRLDPSLPEARQNLAVAALQLGDLPRALSEGETALALQPGTAMARLNFALALDRAGFPVDAAAEAEKVVAAKPDDIGAHLLLGNLNAQKLDRPDRAKAHYRRVIELEPNHPQSVAIRRWLAGAP